MELVSFKINLHGNGFEDRWPKCKIFINEQEFFNDNVQSEPIEFTAKLEDNSNNELIIDYYNRDYKRDVILDADGMPVKSCNIVIESIEIDDIDLNIIPYNLSYIDVYEPWYLEQNRNDWPNPRKEDMQLSWNSRWIMEFNSPVYVWLLENF